MLHMPPGQGAMEGQCHRPSSFFRPSLPPLVTLLSTLFLSLSPPSSPAHPSSPPYSTNNLYSLSSLLLHSPLLPFPRCTCRQTGCSHTTMCTEGWVHPCLSPLLFPLLPPPSSIHNPTLFPLFPHQVHVSPDWVFTYDYVYGGTGKQVVTFSPFIPLPAIFPLQVHVSPDWVFTYDYVYGGTGPPMSQLFADCIMPLVHGLFDGYNATVFAYGQLFADCIMPLVHGLFDGYNATVFAYGQLFADCIMPLVHGLFDGYNATVFAYGQVRQRDCYGLRTREGERV
ncbi:unnamed protein product [Closterium sp. NIES-54]